MWRTAIFSPVLARTRGLFLGPLLSGSGQEVGPVRPPTLPCRSEEASLGAAPRTRIHKAMAPRVAVGRATRSPAIRTLIGVAKCASEDRLLSAGPPHHPRTVGVEAGSG